MRKIISLFTAMILVFSFATASITSAADVKQNQTNEIENKAKEIRQQIKVIEHKYLKRHDADGTFTISDDAIKEVNPEVLKQIKGGMDQINAKIKTHELKSEFKNSQAKVYSNELSISANESKYVWHWYGFERYLNVDESNLAGANFAKMAAGTAVAALIPGITVAAGVVAGVLAYWSATCWQGSANGRGCILYCLGAPSWAQIYSVGIQ